MVRVETVKYVIKLAEKIHVDLQRASFGKSTWIFQ